MAKQIQIDRDLFFMIFNYFSDHESTLPQDANLSKIKEGLASKYLRDSDRQIFYDNRVKKS